MKIISEILDEYMSDFNLHKSRKDCINSIRFHVITNLPKEMETKFSAKWGEDNVRSGADYFYRIGFNDCIKQVREILNHTFKDSPNDKE